MKKETYANSGVQIEKAELFVERIKKRSATNSRNILWQAAGAYAACHPVTESRAVAVTTDGVGTKLLVANELNNHKTIGIDLVAMVANDLICVGATPTIFLDYYAVGKLDDNISDDIIDGILIGCEQAGMILVGGETAELPGLYSPGHYDLAGFALGQLDKSELITGSQIQSGQQLIGLASSGIHSNGLSLARKVLAKENYASLLIPTTIYVKAILSAWQKMRENICGIAHITGGGWRNLLRLNSSVGFTIDNPLSIPDIFQLIAKSVEDEEMYKTFNMGMGLALICQNNADELVSHFTELGISAKIIGSVTDEPGIIRIKNKDFILKNKHV